MNRYLSKIIGALAVLVFFRGTAALATDPEFADVFIASQDGYKSIRIPSVVVTKRGVVLAFAEGRAADADQAGNNLILKRSRDDGRTWLSLELIADDGANSLNNPTAVVEQESGRVFLMYQRIPAHMKDRDKSVGMGYEGTNVYRNFVTWSDDEGTTWAKPSDVTRTTKRPTRATTIASGPGIGIHAIRADRRLAHFGAGELPAVQSHRAIAEFNHLHFVDLAALAKLPVRDKCARDNGTDPSQP